MITKALLSDLVTALRNDQLDVMAYIEEVCDRIDVVEPRIQALLPEQDRRARLTAEAATLKARFPYPNNRPPLYGLLVGVKDIIRVEGFPTRGGSILPAEVLAGPEASCVTVLREAGALILGKTVSTEFAYFEPGPTRNPLNLGHTPGGSSSGSAAAVAAGLCPLALGTQTIGSTIRPAAFCGIIGFKSSYGRILTDGLINLSQSLDHVGLFTQDLAGMRMVAAILCTEWPSHNDTLPTNSPVFGVPEGPFLAQASPEVLTVFETQVARLEAAGYIIRRVKAFDDLTTIVNYNEVICAGEASRVHAEWFQDYGDLYRPKTAELIQKGLQISDQDLAEARANCGALRAEIETLMAQNDIDLWVSPATVTQAPEGISTTGDPAMNLVWTQAGLPAVTLPWGFADNGLPLGLQLVARFNEDEQLLSWAESLAEHTGATFR